MAAIAMLMIVGTLFGLVIAALGHPMIYRAIFKGSHKNTLDS